MNYDTELERMRELREAPRTTRFDRQIARMEGPDGYEPGLERRIAQAMRDEEEGAAMDVERPDRFEME